MAGPKGAGGQRGRPSGSGAERTLTALLQPTQGSSVAPAKHVTSSSQHKELVADAEPFPFYISATDDDNKATFQTLKAKAVADGALAASTVNRKIVGRKIVASAVDAKPSVLSYFG